MANLRVPVEIVFAPNWWFRNYGIRFDRSFYFDREARIRNDQFMRRALWERYGIGAPDPAPRPVIGSEFVAGGFVVPALFGVEVRFEENQAPCPLGLRLSRDQALALKVPDLETTWPMAPWIADMEWLQSQFGSVVGDFNTDGVLNTALQLRGQDFFLDLCEDPEVVDHLKQILIETQVRVATYVRERTGTCSLSVNRSIGNVDRTIYVHANCSAHMMSPALFARTLADAECALAQRLQPYGIHHCGTNLHKLAASFAQSGAVFYDVGWGSKVAECSRALPDAFLNLRLSPMRMLQCPVDEIRRDIEGLMTQADRTGRVGLCAINMDYGTPDENVLALLAMSRA